MVGLLTELQWAHLPTQQVSLPPVMQPQILQLVVLSSQMATLQTQELWHLFLSMDVPLHLEVMQGMTSM